MKTSFQNGYMKNEITFRIAQTDNEIEEAINLRKKVFVEEQNIPLHLEIDGKDKESIHTLATINNEVIGTGRLTIEDKHGILSRIAIDKNYRGLGLGGKIVNRLEEEAIKQKLISLTLKPHIYLEKFYRVLGYVKYGETEKVGEHELINMKKMLIQKTH